MTPWHKRLAAARRRVGLTQEAVAARVGVHRSTYAHYELGRRKPDAQTAVRIARVLGRTVEELFGDGVFPRPRRRALRRTARRKTPIATGGAAR